jgi:hypothetical protein
MGGCLAGKRASAARGSTLPMSRAVGSYRSSPGGRGSWLVPTRHRRRARLHAMLRSYIEAARRRVVNVSAGVFEGLCQAAIATFRHTSPFSVTDRSTGFRDVLMRRGERLLRSRRRSSGPSVRSRIDRCRSIRRGAFRRSPPPPAEKRCAGLAIPYITLFRSSGPVDFPRWLRSALAGSPASKPWSQTVRPSQGRRPRLSVRGAAGGDCDADEGQRREGESIDACHARALNVCEHRPRDSVCFPGVERYSMTGGRLRRWCWR